MASERRCLETDCAHCYCTDQGAVCAVASFSMAVHATILISSLTECPLSPDLPAHGKVGR